MSLHESSVFTHIIKRDGGVKPFDAAKIAHALERAGQAATEFDGAEAQRITQYLVLPRILLQSQYGCFGQHGDKRLLPLLHLA